jgi:polar amino acid transport system substrate-binding protein
MAAIRYARILLVEDNIINQQVAQEILAKANLHVETVNNGKEAVEAVAARDFDAVLMDIQMPVMDGYEATRVIRQDLGKTDLPILAMTAHAVSEERDKCFRIGMNDHIAKPINRNTLFLALSNWIGETAKRHNEKQAADVNQLAIAQTPYPLTQLLAEAERGEAPTGIDFAGGLQRVEGNEKLYLKLLKSFYREQKESLGNIPELLEKNNRQEARHFAHSLKGVAGNIGMSDLQKLSSRAEQKAGYGTAEEFQEIFQKLIQELSQIIEYLAPRVEGVGKQEKQGEQVGAIGPAADEHSRRKALLFLRRLAVLLEQSDFSSLQFLEGNQGIASALLDESSLSSLTGYIEGFHFKNALNLINKIIADQS